MSDDSRVEKLPVTRHAACVSPRCDGHCNRPATPVLWDLEHDTYSDAGEEFMDAIKAAVRPIIAPLTEQFVDALHIGELGTEAVRHVLHEEWMRRQDQP